MRADRRHRIVSASVGAVVGFVIGAIIAVNVVITAGIDQGYEASITEIFAENVLIGVATVVILAAGPIAGVIVALRRRPGH